jgi:DNA replication protein DnaC
MDSQYKSSKSPTSDGCDTLAMDSPRRAACEVCGGTGMQLTRDASGERVASVCPCRAARQALRRLEHANIPKRHEHATLANYESLMAGAHESMLHAHFKANKFVQDYPAVTEGRGLLFVGLSGRGKTHLAVGVLRALIEERAARACFVIMQAS